MVSYDFGGMHPRLAYHMNRKPFTGNPYIIEGFENGDEQSSAKEWISYFKTICLVSLNADNEHDAACAILRKFKGKGITRFSYKAVRSLIRKFKSHHSDIKEYICNDFGIDAMYWDAQIMADCMNNLMIKNGIVVLPEHDELLFSPDTPDVADIVEKQMVESYRKILRLALIDNEKLNNDEPLPENLVPVIKPG